MQRTSIKRNILLLSILIVAILTVCAALFLPHKAALAIELPEGNNAGGIAITSPVPIILNINGKEQDPEFYDDNYSKFTTNNTKNWRTRHITANAAANAATGKYYSFVENSINNSIKPYLDIKTATVNDGVFPYIDIEALSMMVGGDGYFSAVVVNNDDSSDTKTVYFKVTINDTFVQYSAIAEDSQTLYVGNKVENGNESAPSYVGGNHQSILRINNFSTVNINLNEYLRGRALYDGATQLKDGTTNPWTVKSVTNFEIVSVEFKGISDLSLKNEIKSSTPSKNTHVRIAPYVTGRVEITSELVKQYNDAPGNKENDVDFWTQTHMIELKLKLVGDTADDGNAETYSISIPSTFVPANPQSKQISSSYLRLNVTSKNAFNLANKSYIREATEDEDDSKKTNDFGAIYIRPDDLIEYSANKNYISSRFAHSGTLLNDQKDLNGPQMGIRVERVKYENGSYVLDEDNSWPEIYKISVNNMVGDATYNVKFVITYYNGTTNDDGHPYETSINVTTYGGYTVKFKPLEGKDAMSYNALNDSVFSTLRADGYLLTYAESLNNDQLKVTFVNNVLTLAPKVDKIDGQATARVRLEFTNNNREKLTFDSELIDIDVNAGSFWARFDDWEGILIIVAACIGGIILILFIVWIFLRALSKRKQDELAMQAPVSSYIVKLNSTIAATQAQQRMAQNAALSQASTQMLLGAGPASGAAPMPDTLQLASGIPSSPAMSSPSSPLMSEPQATMPPDSGENLEELIAKYISDDELLERIFTEKYEPKGMVRRTFFKSKDLQARELDKEKKRIIERYKTPMPMDEAIMSETEIQRASGISTPAATSEPMASEPGVNDLFVLDFDPDSPLYVEEQTNSDEFTEEKIDLDISPEESRLRTLERQNAILNKELAELKARLDKVNTEVDRAKTLEEELREKIAKAESDDAQYAKDIEDLEFQLASAKNKDKPTITRDIGIKEEKKKRNSDELERLRQELDALLNSSERINGIYSRLNDLQQQKTSDLERITSELEKARSDYNAYADRMEILRKRQELEAKVVSLEPLLEAVNNTDYELKRIDKLEEEQEKEREALKSAVAQAKSQILGATDFGIIADLNAQISDLNAQLSELEREITKTTKQKSDLNIEFNAQRRKANDFIGKNEIPLEEVIKADDKVIGAIEFEIVKARRENEKEEAEKAVADAQAAYEDLSASSNDVTMIAMEVASAISELEEEIAGVQTQLDDINAQMEAASEDERLELMVTQGDTSDKLEELKAQLEQVNIDGTKRKMEAQAEYDEHLERARADLDRANEDFEQACKSFDEFVNNTNPLDLILSGSGIISQDQKKIEAENLKKQLERSKLEAEQARLAVQQAQEQAEEIRRKAMEESEEARRQAEADAQEAIERAEQARREAEEKAKADVEAAEQARKEAEEAMAAEAEEAKRKAEEDAEESKRKAEEDAEEARRKAQEDAEEAKRKAQEEIEEMRRKAEEDAEAKRLEEENKRKEDEARQKAEAERAEAVAKKVTLRRDQIIAIRNEMKELKGDDDAKLLRERLYNLQLTFDEDERGSTELMDFYNKTMDDIQNSGEIARLKAENAKKPQRVVRKVTERVNRIPKRKPGARPAARPGARPGAAARPGARPGARPAARPGARPAARPGARPAARPGARPGAGGPRRPR